MTRIAIRLLGPLRVTVDDTPLTQFYSDKVRALLAYLAVECGQPHRRESLAGLLWPNYAETNARQSLSQALAALRRTFRRSGAPQAGEAAAPWLIATREAIELCPSDAFWTDAAELKALVEACHAHRHRDPCPECAERLLRAASLYEGEFLAGFSLPDSAGFEEWLVVRREHYRREAIECLRTLATQAEAYGDPRDGLAHARRWVELEPLDEEAHRQLMRLLAGCGRRAEALAQYAACRRVLAQELDVAPSPETEALYDGIRAATLTTLTSEDQWPEEGAAPAQTASPLAAPAVLSPLHQLPPAPADFTGREVELQALADAVAREGRLICGIRGPGGIGKTALALALGERLETLYPDAQLYVEMRGTEPQPLTPAEAMAQVVRAYYPLASLPEGEQALRATYRSVLHGQRALLLLDNVRDRAQVEALLPPSTCLLLITSRQHFSLAGLRSLDLGGIALPEAARLLQAIVPRLSDGEAEELARACGRLPLALRVAGSALAEREDLSPEAYLRRLRLDHAGLPAEFEPVEASLALSDALLSGPLRERWYALSAFPETFERAGAQAVWGIEEATEAQDALSELLRYSLIEFNCATERYRLHDLTRAYGRARLGQAAEEQAAERHAAYYAGVLRQVAEAFSQGGEGTLPALSRLDREWVNIAEGQAWAGSHADAPGERGERAARLCCDYAVGIRPNCQLDSYAGGRLDIGLHLAWCQIGLTAARRLGDRWAEATCLGFLGILAAQSNPRSAKEHLEQALGIAQAIGDAHLEGWTLRFLGEAYYALGEIEGTASSARQSLAIAEEIGDHALEVAALRQLGTAHYARGEADRAIAYHERALGLVQSHGFDLDLWALCRSLALDHYALGDARQAVAYGQRALAGAREIGDPAAQHASMYGLGLAYTAAGEPEQAIPCHQENVLYYREVGLLHSVGYNLWALGLAYAALGDDRQAIAEQEEALTIFRDIGERRGQAQALEQMSLAHDRLGECEQAVLLAEEALALYEALEHPQAEAVRAQLAKWRGSEVPGTCEVPGT